MMDDAHESDRVAVDDFSDPNPFTAGPCGPPSVPRQAPRLSHGLLAVRLRCTGGCSGAVLLSTGAQGANLAVKRFATTGSHPVVKLRLPASVARQIRRRGHLRVRIDVSLIELDALTAQRTPGRSLVVSG